METRICPPTEENLRLAAEILRGGGLVGMPTETVYGLAADATNPQAALSVFAAKGRPADNPLIVHISDRAELSGVVAEIPDRAKKLMDAFWPGPLTMILRKADAIPLEVTAGLQTVAVRFPVHPVARALIARTGRPLAAPSANLSGRPSTTTAEHVYHDLAGRIPLILDGGPCQVGLESTVVDLSHGPAVLLRPGGVTREMLEGALQEPVALGKGVMEPLPEGEKALSPGLKHKHYAPKAQVIVVLGEDAARGAYVRAHAGEDAHPCVLCLEKNRSLYGDLPVLSAGATPEDYAHNLFAALRTADEKGYTRVYAEGLSLSGVGLAVMNRVERAAGFTVVRAEQANKKEDRA
ncbi:MAG: L-threonylcarbamoyladenylate synthase [Candidatus Spyradocola sp.]|jgi:L-threonylcarbamoyladenylate synthase